MMPTNAHALRCTLSHIMREGFKMFRFSSDHPQGVYIIQAYETQMNYQVD